jgi:predicted AAA+ superfamily ATPase
MNYIKRDIENTVLQLSSEYSAILVCGPRQVGKTTMLSHIMPAEMHYVTLDDFTERDLAKSDPKQFLLLHQSPVLIDEVQYAPELFSYIKIAIDNGAPSGSFWLTGSQSFSIMRLAQESLAGRVAILSMSGMSQHELYGSGDAAPFRLDTELFHSRKSTLAAANTTEIYNRIWLGGLPGHVSGKYTNRNIFFSSYVQTYIERDIRYEISGVDEHRFADFIRAAACRTGQMLNTHAIATDVGVSDDTAKRWLAVLMKSGIIYFLYPYSNNLLKRNVKTPKMYFFDTGLVAYLTKYTSSDILLNGAINGAILENYVVGEIIKSYTNCGQQCILHYFRDKDNVEVDLVMEENGLLHPIEIKKASTAEKRMIKSFAVLEKASIPIGVGAVLCTTETLSAFDKDNLIVPIWLI